MNRPSPGAHSVIIGIACGIGAAICWACGFTAARHGIAIGLSLTLIHLISIPVTNTSVNPARSFGPAIFVGGWAIKQLWMFFVAPLLGAVLGALIYRLLSHEPEEEIGPVEPA